MGEIARRQRAHRVRQIAQDVGEQSVVEMHADRFANVILAGAVQAERDAGLIEMSVETRRCLERADVKLVWVFHRNFRFVRD